MAHNHQHEFWQRFSPQKQWVDDAIRYAESKNVLLVKAAGNDNKNVDVEDSYPSVNYLNGKGRAGNVITVGASGDPKTGGWLPISATTVKKKWMYFSRGKNIFHPAGRHKLW